MKSTTLYTLVMAFILGWWWMAFHSSPPNSLAIVHSDPHLKTCDLLSHLSPLQRDSLKQALAGNTKLMLKLILVWEKDAEILSAKGIKNVKRLPAEELLQATLIGQLTDGDLQDINNKLRCKSIQDDCGNVIALHKRSDKILPQTDMAASFLLALCEPKEMVALPVGVSKSPLYDPQKIRQIPLCAHSLHSEQLHLLKPDVALLAYYSHPGTKELFHHLSIPLYTTKNLNTVEEIQTSLLKVGHLCNHPLEATLLSIFMHSAFLTIDNRITLLSETASLKNVLYLYHHYHYMVPTTKCLSGQLMTRAAMHYPGMSCFIPTHETHWRLPFEQEKIIQANPDCILMAAAHPSLIPSMHELSPVPSGKIFFLDEYVQESPTQYTVLAYFDIFHVLAAAHTL